MIDATLEKWADLKTEMNFSGILLGNGSSMAVWPQFAYASLFEVARTANATKKLTGEDVALFDAFNTRNFEHVLASLSVCKTISQTWGMTVSKLESTYSRIQGALAEAVKSTHIPWEKVPDDTLERIRDELGTYAFVFSTNYDLLVYWAVMHENTGRFKDYFWGETFDLANVAIWTNPPVTRVVYLHGGLHLCRSMNGRTKKRKATGKHNLLDLFGDAENSTPLFVTEGTADDKFSSIAKSDYLTFSYSNLVNLKGSVCIFGHSLEDSDKHIVQAIAKSDVKTVAVSIRKKADVEIKQFKAHIHKILPQKDVRFFDAATHPLGADVLLSAGGGA